MTADTRTSGSRMAADPNLPVPAPTAAVTRKRVKIRRDVELVKYGFTPNCVGCDAAIRGADAQNHTEACRIRIEACMSADPEGAEALERAAQRRHLNDWPRV